jgi:hypothetical protein
MRHGQDYRNLVRERYRASLMSDAKWRQVFTLMAAYDPPLQLWISWVDGGAEEQLEAPRVMDDQGAAFEKLGWRPYLAIERLSLGAYVRRPPKSKLSSYQPIESLREALRSLGQLPLEGTPNGGLRIVGHLPAVMAPTITDDQCDRLEPPFDGFARMLFAAYPDWRAHAKLEEDDDGKSHLWVEVAPLAEADLNGPLWITTDGGEVTVGIDYSHAHFDWPPDEYSDALEHIDDLLNERLVTYGKFKGEWLQSGGVQSHEEPLRVPDLEVSKLRVRSWRGTHNRDQLFAWPPSKR